MATTLCGVVAVVNPAATGEVRGRSATRQVRAQLSRPNSAPRCSASLSPAPAQRVEAGALSSRRHASRPRVAAPPAVGATVKVYAGASTLNPSEDAQDRKSAEFSSAMKTPTSMAKIGSQLGGGGAGLLEKTSLNLSQSVEKSSAKVADNGGGGNNGGGIKNGGGGGDGDEGDDDDYFDEGDDEEGDDGFMAVRSTVPETYNREAIQAVMAEWYKTLADLPAGLRMAIEMGMVSCSQLVRFMSVDVRPSMVRAVSRSTPDFVSRGFVGRLMADPAFLWKIGFEQAVTIGGATLYEVAHRGDRLKAEWDLAASNIAQLSFANALTVWCIAPSRSFGGAERFGLQRFMASMPNNAFDRAGPLRQYTKGTRAASVLLKAAELAALGVATGAVFGGVNQMLVKKHQAQDPDFAPSVPVPDVKTQALGMGAFLGLSCNLRYQLMGGCDRWMTERLSSLATAVTGTALMRLGNNQLGDSTRLFALGLPMHASAAAVASRPSLEKALGGKTKTVKKKKKVKKEKKEKEAVTA